MADIWFDVDAALSEVPINKFPLIDDGDFKSREESVTYNQAGLDLVWNFLTTAGAFSQTAVTPTDTGGNYDFVNQGNGMYTIEVPASGGASINNDTEGFGWFTGFATGILPWISPVFGFRRKALNDLLINGSTASTNLEDFFDGTGYAGGTAKLECNTVKVNGTNQTARDLGASVTQTGDAYAVAVDLRKRGFNKLAVTDATGAYTLYDDNSTDALYTGTVTDNLTTTIRTKMA